MKPLIHPFGDGVVSLRPVEARDLETILAWRNRDEARIWFKTADKLSLSSHRAWYERYLAKDDDFFFIIEADSTPVGQCAIYDVDRATGSAEIGRFLAAPDAAGRGYITRACRQLIAFGVQTLRLSYLYLEVIKNNERAAAIYRRCGFAEEGCDSRLVRMGLRWSA